MTTFTYSITSLPAYPEIDGEVDVVFQVNWTCVATDGTYSAMKAGSVELTLDSSSPFTPYADLTQEQVWSWIDPTIDRPQVEIDLQASIDAQKNPPVVVNPLPWATPI